MILDLADTHADGMITSDMYMTAVLDDRFPVRRHTLISEYKGQFLSPDILERRARMRTGSCMIHSVPYSLFFAFCLILHFAYALTQTPPIPPRPKHGRR